MTERIHHVVILVLFLMGPALYGDAGSPKATWSTVSRDEIPVAGDLPTTFEANARAPFLGLVTHTKTVAEMEEKISGIASALDANPFISGVTIKIRWNQLHPEKDQVKWDRLEELVQVIASRGKFINLSLIAGYHCPEWIYREGVEKVVTGQGVAPHPWDPVYMQAFTRDIEEIARRYADDPRIYMMVITGHNFQGEEMHAPPPGAFGGKWDRDQVVANWRYWIDLFRTRFPAKRLSLVISQMYPGDAALPDTVADYFIDQCRGRAVLQMHQLNGREAAWQQSAQVCARYSAVAPHCNELVGSMKEQPLRQGTPEMTVYNFIKMGNPLFLQLWRRDCDDPRYAESLLKAWEELGQLSPDAARELLLESGRFVEKSTWKPARPS